VGFFILIPNSASELLQCS